MRADLKTSLTNGKIFKARLSGKICSFDVNIRHLRNEEETGSRELSRRLLGLLLEWPIATIPEVLPKNN